MTLYELRKKIQELEESSRTLPDALEGFEVGFRDGLQHSSRLIDELEKELSLRISQLKKSLEDIRGQTYVEDPLTAKDTELRTLRGVLGEKK